MNEEKILTKEIELGNVVALEHINLAVPNQKIATIFYILGLGLTRDPYMSVGHENMWINIGHQQFHLPTRVQQKIPGTIGLVVPSLSALSARLRNVALDLNETAFSFESESTKIDITCPWGNQIICTEAEFGSSPMVLGIHYINFDVPVGTSEQIGEFYSEILQASVESLKDTVGICVSVGNSQSLVFQETLREIPAYDGHHIAIYLNEFKEVYSSLDKFGLVTEVSGDFQYRFEDIVDISTGKNLLKLEHEVRDVAHPMFQRDLINRNPNQGLSGYVSGNDRFM